MNKKAETRNVQRPDHPRKTSTSGLPRWSVAAACVAAVWALVYAIINFLWASGGTVGMPPIGYGTDITSMFHSSLFRGYSLFAGSLLGAAVIVALAPLQSWGRILPRWVLLTIAWATCMVLVGTSSGFVVIDALRLIGVIPLPVDGPGFLIRGLSLLGGILWGVMALLYQRWSRGSCLFCGRSDSPTSTRWIRIARGAGYLSFIPALIYSALKVYWSLGGTFGYTNPTIAVTVGRVGEFDPTIVLAAMAALTALALVQSWGEKLPRWVPLFFASGACMLLVPGGLTGTMAVIYKVFGSTSLPASYGGLVLPVFILVYFCFLIWGIMLGIAALSYYFRTRGPCKHCGRSTTLE